MATTQNVFWESKNYVFHSVDDSNQEDRCLASLEFFNFVNAWSQASVKGGCFFIIMNAKFVCFYAVFGVSLLFIWSGLRVNEL